MWLEKPQEFTLINNLNLYDNCNQCHHHCHCHHHQCISVIITHCHHNQCISVIITVTVIIISVIIISVIITVTVIISASSSVSSSLSLSLLSSSVHQCHHHCHHQCISVIIISVIIISVIIIISLFFLNEYPGAGHQTNHKANHWSGKVYQTITRYYKDFLLDCNELKLWNNFLTSALCFFRLAGETGLSPSKCQKCSNCSCEHETMVNPTAKKTKKKADLQSALQVFRET